MVSEENPLYMNMVKSGFFNVRYYRVIILVTILNSIAETMS